MQQQQVPRPPLPPSRAGGEAGGICTPARCHKASGGPGIPAPFAGLRWRFVPDSPPAGRDDGQP
jgi:hypothetical protein